MEATALPSIPLKITPQNYINWKLKQEQKISRNFDDFIREENTATAKFIRDKQHEDKPIIISFRTMQIRRY